MKWKEVQLNEHINFVGREHNKIADKYNGTEIKTSLPFKLEILQIISSIFKLTSLEAKINTKQKFLSFEFIQPDFELKYIVQGLVK